MRKVILLLCLATFSGCAFSPVKKPDVDGYAAYYPKTHSVRMEPVAALDAVRSALEGLGFEIQTVNPDLGIVRTKARDIVVGPTCWCGRWNGEVIEGTAQSALVLTGTKEEGGTLLSIEHECGTTFTGTNMYGVPTVRETYRCASKGELEKEFWRTLERVLQARGVPGGLL